MNNIKIFDYRWSLAFILGAKTRCERLINLNKIAGFRQVNGHGNPFTNKFQLKPQWDWDMDKRLQPREIFLYNLSSRS